MEKALVYPQKVLQIHAISQPKWQRILLLCVLAYEGLGAMLGGILLIAAPDGQLMDMPVHIMNGVFQDFLIPGYILFGLGILNSAAFVSVVRKARSEWIISSVAMGGLLLWFLYEISILQQLHWLHIMWGLPVVAGFMVTWPLAPQMNERIRKNLLLCGILSSLLYFVINIFVPTAWDGYSYLSQVPSELSAIGAPTRLFWMLACIPYTPLVIAFGWGVWKSAGESRALSIAGKLLIAYGATGLLWPFAPMHMREALVAGEGTFGDTMHKALAGVTVILYLLSLALSATLLGKRFRIFSILTFALVLITGTMTFLQSPGIAANQSTPTIGLWERISIGAFLVWTIVLAKRLMKRENRSVLNVMP